MQAKITFFKMYYVYESLPDVAPIRAVSTSRRSLFTCTNNKVQVLLNHHLSQLEIVLPGTSNHNEIMTWIARASS